MPPCLFFVALARLIAMKCPRCGSIIEDNAKVCPDCGAYFVDRFTEILSSETKLKTVTTIFCVGMIAAFSIASLVMLIVGIPAFGNDNGLGWLSVALVLFFLTDIILLLTLYFHNKSDNVFGGKSQIAFCIVSSLLGCFPAALPFMIRGIRIRKKLEGK